MGRQFPLYLLPEDAEGLIAKLRRSVGLRLIGGELASPEAVDAGTPVCQFVNGEVDLTVYCRCYLVPPWTSEVKMRRLPAQGRWYVDPESEVIEFSGCNFRGNLLVQGRFYYQREFVAGDAFVLKGEEFLRWAEQVFRTAKKLLRKRPGVTYSYVGEAAERWKAEGGRFAHFVRADGVPLYDD